jgi:putative membrane protein insertion efficiency factor
VTRPSPAGRLFLLVLTIFRAGISPMLGLRAGPPVCRFEPSCSAYAELAVRRHGAAGGAYLAVRRILRCHPWGGFGEDPVPPVREHGHRHVSRTDARDSRTARQHVVAGQE